MRALEKACISYKNKRFGDNKVENACTRFSQLVVSWCSDWKGVRVEGSLCCFEYWMLIESHSRFIAASATSKLGIMKKVFLIVWWSGHGFEVSFELPSPSFRVLLSGLNVCWLQLLIFVFLIVWSQRLVVCDLDHKHRFAALCMFCKIRCDPNYALEAELPRVRVPAMLARTVLSVHSMYLDLPRNPTV